MRKLLMSITRDEGIRFLRIPPRLERTYYKCSGDFPVKDFIRTYIQRSEREAQRFIAQKGIYMPSFSYDFLNYLYGLYDAFEETKHHESTPKPVKPCYPIFQPIQMTEEEAKRVTAQKEIDRREKEKVLALEKVRQQRLAEKDKKKKSMSHQKNLAQKKK